MSTRKTTRAGSRAASTQGARAIAAEDIPPTPEMRPPGRRSRRGDSLPPVAPTTSTAYGTNTLAIPDEAIHGAPLANDISDVIQGLLEPAPRPRPSQATEGQTPDVDAPATQPAPGLPAINPKTRSKTGFTTKQRPMGTTPVDRSFQNESGIFDNASIQSFVDDHHYQRFTGPADENEKLRRAALKSIAEDQQHIRGGTGRGTGPGFFSNLNQNMSGATKSFSSVFKNLFKKSSSLLLLIPLLLIGITTFGAITGWLFHINDGKPYRFYGPTNVKNNIGQFVPWQLRHPTRMFAPEDLQEVHIRLHDAEADIAYLKHRSDVDKSAIAEIERILPDFVALERDPNGNHVIPANLWYALREKIRGDPALIPRPIVESSSESKPSKSSPKSSQSEPSRPQAPQSHVAMTAKEWDRYLESNRVKIQSWAGSELEALLPNRLEALAKDGRIASRDQVLRMIADNWKETQREVKTELQQSIKQLEARVIELSYNLEERVLTAEQVKHLARDVISAQIAALTRANMNKDAGKSILRVNHFALGSGAVIDPHLTSPRYYPKSMNVNFLVRGLSHLLGRRVPKPNPAESALSQWEDYGECWCSPSKSKNGWGPSLGIITAHSVYPDQIVVEHFPQEGSLSPGSTPRDMELFAKIRPRAIYQKIKAKSQEIFQDDDYDELGDGWVRIASWRFGEADDPIQPFPIQIDLKDFITSAPHDLKNDLVASNKFVVRSKDNWSNGNVPFTCLYRVRLHGEVRPEGDGW